MSNISISCRDLKVSYDLHSHKVSTLKEFVIMKAKGNLSKTKKLALNNINFEAKRGECVALIGHNGCGKSTLLKCIAGILKPNEGIVETNGRIAPMIELGAGFDSEMTGRENVYLSCSLLGLIKSEIDEKMAEIEKLSELGEFFDAPVKTYSSGMYMRLGFACTTAIAADIVLIDEILAVGDENFQKKCLARINAIRNSGCTVVLVSHDLNIVLNMADRAYVIDQGRVLFNGDTVKAIGFYHQIMDEKRFASLSPEEQEEELRRIRLEQDAAGGNFGVKAKVVEVNPIVSVSARNLISLQISLQVRLFQDFEESVVVGFSLVSSNHVRIFGGNTKFLPREKVDPIKATGNYTVLFEFEDLPLAAGKYHFTVGIHNQHLDETIDIQGNVAEFKVTNILDPDNFDQDLLNPGIALVKCNVEKKKAVV